MKDQIKCVIVGDSLVGKTCMLSVLVNNTFPRNVQQTVFDSYSSNLLVDHQHFLLDLCDTAGAEDYDRLRPLSYPETDVFVVALNVVSEVGLSNVVDKWLPEIRQHCPEVPFILVGNQTDLRASETTMKSTTKRRLKSVSRPDGEKLAQEVGAVAYMECSARKQDGVTEVFEAAVRAAYKGHEPSPKPSVAPSKCCVS
ncbi:hypothetical protein CAPTEDRAFT_94008 [Capitella teleta]|uniref:Small monomeric GTPase n=1 Tax=Capitella teleta TaxID=283909 RepID=R7UR92_CAPTE|nr:hypothetical protein CAPTEDRAFT_94008 [Capitella teleta]|eukprot:ELU05936.1 hypothetical protein CAPTEDRAFT_94008 [Capitella teleta]